MKYHVLVDGEHHEVLVHPRGGGLEVTLDGNIHQVDVGLLKDGSAYSLLMDERSVDVGVEERDAAIHLLIAGGRYTAEVLGEREWLARSIRHDEGAGERLVRAVMSGIVREVRVASGDTVAAGQILFILEAMKMENEVRAEVDGTVARVAVEIGSTVNQGDIVVEIA